VEERHVTSTSGESFELPDQYLVLCPEDDAPHALQEVMKVMQEMDEDGDNLVYVKTGTLESPQYSIADLRIFETLQLRRQVMEYTQLRVDPEGEWHEEAWIDSDVRESCMTLGFLVLEHGDPCSW